MSPLYPALMEKRLVGAGGVRLNKKFIIGRNVYF